MFCSGRWKNTERRGGGRSNPTNVIRSANDGYLYGKNARAVHFPTNNCRDKIIRCKKVDI